MTDALDLLVPDADNRQGQLEVPLGDVTLASGLKLRFRGGVPVTGDQALAGHMAVYERDGLRVLASIDVTPRWSASGARTSGPLLHVSLSRRDRDVAWSEIRQVKAAFFGDAVDAMMVLPRAEDYIAGVPGWEDSNVFHVWQCPEGWRLQ